MTSQNSDRKLGDEDGECELLLQQTQFVVFKCLRAVSWICMSTFCSCLYVCMCECLLSFWPRTLITRCDGWWAKEGGGGPYYRPWDQSHQCVLKKSQLHSRDELCAVMMLTQVWSMCTLPSHLACIEKEVYVSFQEGVCIMGKVTGDCSKI